METEEILNIGKQIIESEINEIKRMSVNLNQNFAQCVKTLFKCQGKIVVVGVGKNAPIAQKMVATLNSTGSIAQFLHAGEALHGDVGLIQPQDVCLVLSKSGNTAEIKSSLPSIKQFSSKVIAITGNLNSYLAQNSDIILDATVEKEAGILNLAPTSSTTVQLVMCDAIAMTLQQLKKFSAEDFSKFHPGGSLGKQLLLKVEDMLDETQKPQVDSDASIKEVIQSLSSGRFGITVVMNKNEIIGVVTDGDLRRMLEKYTDFSHLRAHDIASFEPKTIKKSILAKTALQLINQYKIGQLVVVDDDNNYVGIVDFHGLTNEGIRAA